MMLTSAVYSEIEDHILRRMEEQGVPGASVAIIHDNKPLLLRGYGFADIKNQIPVTESTTFQIASLTKQFTACLILMLAHDGLLHLDDSISKWFPEGGSPWSLVSVRHLVAHLSGISDEPMDAMDDQREYTEDEMVAAIASAPLVSSPGTKWDYCNSGYVLLGALVRRVTGRFWGDVLRERIFVPAGMKTARVVDEVIGPNRAIGYEMEGGVLDEQRWKAPCHNTTADGGLLMSAEDFVGWSAALSSEVLLPQSVIQEMWNPIRFRDGKLAGTKEYRFGLGWMLPVVAGLPRIAQHRGAWQGFSTYIGRLIDTCLTVTVLTNLDDEFSHPDMIGHNILLALALALALARD
jgi:CubicO group peptidase (beta-lactamase class C family)